MSVDSALIHAWTCAFGDPGRQDILVQKRDAVDLMAIQVAVARFPGMKHGTNLKVGEFQPLKGLSHQRIVKRSLWRSRGHFVGASIC